MNTCTHMGKPTHKNKYIHIVQNRINQIYLLRNDNVTTICKKSSLPSLGAFISTIPLWWSSFPGSPCQHHMADTGWRKLQLLSKILQKLIKKITTSPLACILETGSFENAGGRGRVTCHLQGFCSKVKSHIQISTTMLPSVWRARKHRRRKSSKAALVQTFLVLRQAWFDMRCPAGPVLLPQRSDAARLLDSTSQWGFFFNQTKSLFGASTAQLLWVLSDSELAVTTAQVNVAKSKGQNLLSSLHSNWCYLAYPSYYWGKWNVPY